jgi:hypothetical protein
MTLGIDNSGEPIISMPKREFVSIFSAGAGVVALVGFLSFWAVIPERVTRLELHDKEQDVTLAAIKEDSAQRRELLAGALATLSQINDRTKRIEDHLLQEKDFKK